MAAETICESQVPARTSSPFLLYSRPMMGSNSELCPDTNAKTKQRGGNKKECTALVVQVVDKHHLYNRPTKTLDTHEKLPWGYQLD